MSLFLELNITDKLCRLLVTDIRQYNTCLQNTLLIIAKSIKTDKINQKVVLNIKYGDFSCFNIDND